MRQYVKRRLDVLHFVNIARNNMGEPDWTPQQYEKVCKAMYRAKAIEATSNL